ncbi:MAG: L-threonylcarbamoyladenylate synthase [Acetobacteraceae bacterium]
MQTELLSPDPTGIALAASLIRAGQLVAFATETVYGLGADATNETAVAALFRAKGRPLFNPLICHYASSEAAFVDAVAGPLAQRLAEKFWPGPLTLVLPRRAGTRVAPQVSANLPTLAVRIPAPAPARALIEAAAVPIAAPSANRSGRVSPTTAAHVLAELEGLIAAVLDCGQTTVGVESSVLDLTGERPTLLRPGGATAEDITAVAGPLAAPPLSGAPHGPGMLASHYAPLLALRLHATEVAAEEALLAFGAPLAGAGLTFNLSRQRDLTEAATRLFSGLRFLDSEGRRSGLLRIAVMEVPGDGLGRAIVDRLARAATPGRTALREIERTTGDGVA